MITTISILNIGFSVVSALVLYIAYLFFLNNVNKSWFALSSCAGLIICLLGLQLGHLEYLINDTDVLKTPYYRFWLFLAPSMFYYFSRATLLPDARLHPLMLLHLSPSLLNFIVRDEIAVPLLFLVGTGYSFWLANIIYGFRAQRKRFHIEIFFFGLFSITAVLILILGVSVPYIDNGIFYLFYANSIALAFILIVAALIVFPDLLSDLAEVAKLSYEASTLTEVDIDACLKKLDQLVRQSKLYQNENLSLAMVAHETGITGHQLSELINVYFGINFSRYIREQRIDAAKILLEKEPNSTVLAISLETGFKSQSNFYVAFKEITGMSPGAYRKSITK